jgi:hypothetical protein
VQFILYKHRYDQVCDLISFTQATYHGSNVIYNNHYIHYMYAVVYYAPYNTTYEITHNKSCTTLFKGKVT